ncbi:MAG: hypothetical protein ABID64_00375 [Nitrospirota bacterium]
MENNLQIVLFPLDCAQINMKIFKNKKGLILAEALLAIAILGIGTMVIASLVDSGTRTMVLSKNYLIAQNLAMEAVETVNSVRDTNWLLQADDLGCWLELDPDGSPGCAFKAVIGSYIPEVSGSEWKLTEIFGGLDLENGGSDENYRLKKDTSAGYERYVYGGIGDNSIFYRGINVLNLVDAEADGIDDYAEFEVVVEWKEGQKIRSIRWPFILYNHYS